MVELICFIFAVWFWRYTSPKRAQKDNNIKIKDFEILNTKTTKNGKNLDITITFK